MVDCYVNCVNYLQMVGLVREWGFIKVQAVQGKKISPNNAGIKRMFLAYAMEYAYTKTDF